MPCVNRVRLPPWKRQPPLRAPLPHQKRQLLLPFPCLLARIQFCCSDPASPLVSIQARAYMLKKMFVPYQATNIRPSTIIPDMSLPLSDSPSARMMKQFARARMHQGHAGLKYAPRLIGRILTPLQTHNVPAGTAAAWQTVRCRGTIAAARPFSSCWRATLLAIAV